MAISTQAFQAGHSSSPVAHISADTERVISPLTFQVNPWQHQLQLSKLAILLVQLLISLLIQRELSPLLHFRSTNGNINAGKLAILLVLLLIFLLIQRELSPLLQNLGQPMATSTPVFAAGHSSGQGAHISAKTE